MSKKITGFLKPPKQDASDVVITQAITKFKFLALSDGVAGDRQQVNNAISEHNQAMQASFSQPTIPNGFESVCDSVFDPMFCEKVQQHLKVEPKTQQVYFKSFNEYLTFLKDKKLPHTLRALNMHFDMFEKLGAAPNSLFTRYGALNSMLRCGLGQDLNNYPTLKKKLAKYKKIQPAEKKAKEFEHEEWVRSQEFEASSQAEKVHILIDQCASNLGVFGGIRGHSAEKVCWEWFGFPEDKQEGDLPVKIGAAIKGLGGGKHSFIIPASFSKPFFEMRQLQPDHQTGRFFKFYDPKTNKFTKRFLGKNNLAKAGIRIATRLGLQNPELYTGHCWRRTGATILAEAGATEQMIMAYGSWSTPKVARMYIAQSQRQKRNIASAIARGTLAVAQAQEMDAIEHQGKKQKVAHTVSVFNPPSTVLNSTSNSISKLSPAMEAMTFNNCNVTFNF